MTTRNQTCEVAGPSTPTIKRLFARSGNRCAFPRCSSPIVEGMTVVGKICHIKARSEGGPRYDPLQTSAERHGYDNLILLCGRHHDVIDDDTVAYTVERLQQMKSAHEATATLLSSEQAAHGAQLLLDQSVSTTNQSGGITAQNVVIHYHGEPAARRDSSERQTRDSVSPSSARPSPNLAFVAFDAMPVSEAGSGLWTGEMGIRERDWLTANGELALLARFTNEPQ
jgi:hypothetical protein